MRKPRIFLERTTCLQKEFLTLLNWRKKQKKKQQKNSDNILNVVMLWALAPLEFPSCMVLV